MDIYEATQSLLQTAVQSAEPAVSVSAYVLTYDVETDKYMLPDFPAVTYNFQNLTPIASISGDSDLIRVSLDIECWGDLGQIDANAKLVREMLNAKRVEVGNVEFTLVMMESRDIAELGLDFKRRYMRFVGLAEIGEENGQTGL